MHWLMSLNRLALGDGVTLALCVALALCLALVLYFGVALDVWVFSVNSSVLDSGVGSVCGFC